MESNTTSNNLSSANQNSHFRSRILHRLFIIMKKFRFKISYNIPVFLPQDFNSQRVHFGVRLDFLERLPSENPPSIPQK